MENEPPTIIAQDEGRSKRGRIIGKLFGRDRKVSNEEQSKNLNDFLRGPTDTLSVAHAAPPLLTKLDTSSASRYPNALTVEQRSPQPAHHLSLRQRSHSPRTNNKKGLVVRFVDTFPEVIGQGGDECDMPTVEISKQRRPRPPPVTAITAPPRPADIIEKPSRAFPEFRREDDSFIPTQIRRTQTGYSTVSNAPEPEIPAGQNAEAKYLGTPVTAQDEKRKSFTEIHYSQMREAEGLAFANAVRSGSNDRDPEHNSPRPSHDHPAPPTLVQSPEFEDSPPPEIPPHQQPPPSPQPPTHRLPLTPNLPQPPPSLQPPESPDTKLKRNQALEALEALEQSPSSVYSTSSSLNRSYGSLSQHNRFLEKENGSSPSSPLKAGMSLHEAVLAASDEALNIFVLRTRHLFELFRLHSETVRPLLSCSLEELGRAGLWWFLAGRLALENAVRERPETPTAQQRNEMAKQQAYANLAKGYWLFEEVVPEVSGAKQIPVSLEVEEARKSLASNLRKLAISMKRNGFLPPEEAMLPQTIDKSIWLEYPNLSQDIITLLWGSSNSALTQAQLPVSGLEMQEALPLGDSPFFFCYGRIRADVFLMEQGMESQRFHLPCMLSIIRSQKQPDMMFILASQNHAVQLRISTNKAFGPTWDDIRWRSDSCTLDIRLPRGFILVVQCSPADFRMLWNMYDFSSKVQASLYPVKDEKLIFRSTLRAFQYFDNDPQARPFPKESVPNCEVALFERLLHEGAATGPRTYHMGYRLAIVTGTRTKALNGINQAYHPRVPVQYGFLRSELNDPALSLKFENSRSKGNMVLSFNDEQERLRLHSLLIGTALHNDEQVCAEVPLQGLWFSERFGDTNNKGLVSMSHLPWQRARVINDKRSDRPPCVLADKFRVVFEFKDGMITDRINVAPGEFKIRLDAANPSCMMVYRLPQKDMTVAVTEAKVPRENTMGLTQGVDVLQEIASIRTYMFPTIQDLHTFETAITGFQVLFDRVASAFAISRRRMVVPIHKKWEAGATRIQIVQQDGVTQLLAFFEEFSHGQCMSFALKGTDVFECFSRSSKFGLKIDDAKFPLPKILGNTDDAQAAADAAFVCLDLPELPGEHDDISILFDNETDRDNLIPCLPAPVKGSRLSKGR